MRSWIGVFSVGSMLLTLWTPAVSQQSPSGETSRPVLVQTKLTEVGATPFHLKATITEGREQDPIGRIEMVWLAPNKWRRTIEVQDFSQTLIVNGDMVYEQDSDDYFPLGVRVLATAAVDPGPVLDAHRPGDILLTKANGSSDESGRVCFGGKFNMCVQANSGLLERVGTPGYSIDFVNYMPFGEKRAARLINFTVGVGEFLTLRIDELTEVKSTESVLSTPKDKQIRSAVLSESALRDLGLSTPEIIWPQVLDGAITGNASFYIVLDQTGRVREVLPVHTANERSNDSARRQLMKWIFKPVVKDGFPVQAEAILNFKLNTRAWGPASPLSDAEARKLASNTVEPIVPPGIPAGTTYTMSVAIDSDGKIIEEIAGGGPSALFRPCMDALGKWQFKPFLENGEPKPYRATITFVVH